MEPFAVKHYSADERPTLKGNGFDGLEIGEDREEAEQFVVWINERIATHKELLAALQRVVAVYDQNTTGYLVGDAFNRAREAIAHAEKLTTRHHGA